MPENKPKTDLIAHSGHHPKNHQLDLFPVMEVERDGVQMGVLSDGSPYLTLRGLARMCGVDNAALVRLISNWDEEKTKPRGKRIKELLAAQGHPGEILHIKTRVKGQDSHAIVDSVCMAILEYYAFETTQGDGEIARNSFRLLARSSFRSFIYNRCGYDPDKHIPESWRNFHERVLMNDQVPVGFFSVFREIADLVVHMIQSGCPIDDHTVPDISIGKAWSQHWEVANHEFEYGPREKHPHDYPSWFPQSKANPVAAWIYPVGSLGEFRVWLYEIYIPLTFPGYVAGNVKKGVFLPSRAELLIEAVNRKNLEHHP